MDIWRPNPADPGIEIAEERAREALDGDRELLRAYIDWLKDPDHLAAENPLNPSPGRPGQGYDRNDRCNGPNKGVPRYVPVRKPGYVGDEPEGAVKQDFTALSPTGTHLPISIHLRWGSIANNWGYRKIAYKHGWGPSDIADTEAALLDPDPDWQSDSSWIYSSVFTRNGVSCRRKVVVEYGESQYDDFGPKYIITSYNEPG